MEARYVAVTPRPHELAESCEHDSHAFRHRSLSRRRPDPAGLTLRGARGRTPSWPGEQSSRRLRGLSGHPRLSGESAGSALREQKNRRTHEDSNLDCRFRIPEPVPLADASLEMRARIELAHDGFADRRVPISPPHRIGTGDGGRTCSLPGQSRTHRRLCYSRKIGQGGWSRSSGLRCPRPALCLLSYALMNWSTRQDSNPHLPSSYLCPDS